VGQPETKEHLQVVTDHQHRPGMPRQMLMADQRRPDPEDNIQPITAEQRSLSHPADTEIEMETSTKLLLCFPDVTTVEPQYIVLVNARLGLTDRQHRRRKLQHRDNRMSDR